MKHLLRILAVFALAISALHATDLTVTAGSVVPGARAKTAVGTAAATITAGQLVYLTTAGTYNLADADASAAAANVVGIAASGASAGQPFVIVLEDDDLTVGATLSMVTPVYVLSGTAGGIAPTADIGAGDYPIVVLIAKSTTKAVFKIIRGPAPAVGA
jgi:hypothetical protein